MQPPSVTTSATSTATLLPRQYTGGTDSHRDAQFFLAYIGVHREPMVDQLSLDAAYLLTGFCIPIAICVTFSCTWGHWRMHTLALQATPSNSPAWSSV